MTVGLLAPGARVGLLNLAIYLGAALVQFWTFGPEVRANLDAAEPWATVAFGSFSVVLLMHRLRGLELERKAAKAEVEARAYERLARVLMAVRDLSNTPLQTIHFAGVLIERRAPELHALTGRIHAAVLALRKMNELLAE